MKCVGIVAPSHWCRIKFCELPSAFLFRSQFLSAIHTNVLVPSCSQKTRNLLPIYSSQSQVCQFARHVRAWVNSWSVYQMIPFGQPPTNWVVWFLLHCRAFNSSPNRSGRPSNRNSDSTAFVRKGDLQFKTIHFCPSMSYSIDISFLSFFSLFLISFSYIYFF